VRISRREARQLKKRVRELEERDATRIRSWSSEYPGGVNIASEYISYENHRIIEVANQLGCYVVVKAAMVQGKEGIRLYGVRA
jgi:hypothetical protein